jgi:hypothetical protein
MGIMAGFRIEGNTSGNVAEVNTLNEIKVALNTVNSDSGYATITCASDDGEILGDKLWIDPEASEDNKLRVGLDSLLLDESFPGTVLNSNIFTTVVTTMTATVAGGFLNLNAGLSVASAAVARVATYRYFQINAASETYFETNIKFSQSPVANNVCEWGLFIASGTAAPTDGIFFRLNQAGEFRGVINNAGIEIQSDAIDFNANVGLDTTSFVISIGNTVAKFWVNGKLAAYLPVGATGSTTSRSMHLPVTYRIYNSAATSAAQQMQVGSCSITSGDLAYNKPYEMQASGAGWHSSYTQTGAAAHGMTAQFTNNANPTAAAPTNTTAALGSGLGGLFFANINGLAVGTDFIIQSFQVPVGTADLPGKSLYITDITVSGSNEVVANGAGITNWIVSLAHGHTAVSLATAQAATTKIAKRQVLGMQSLPATAPVGTLINQIDKSFNTPIHVAAGEFVQIFIRFKNNNSAATQRIDFAINIDGFFE